MRGIESEDSCYQDIEWTADLEVHLLFAMVGIKPVGIHRSFHMLRIWDKFTSSINKNVPPKAIWKHLETMYDLATLDEAEGLQFPNDFKEFSLPGEEFEELMTAKRKGLAINLETTDESSSDVVLGSLIEKESKENDDNLETEKVEETDETADAPSARKKKLSLSLKKRRRNEEEKNKGDNTTSDEGVEESSKKKRTKRESENSEVKEENQKIVSEDDDRKNVDDKEKEPVVRSQTPRGRKQAKNKKNKKSNVEDEKFDDSETKQDPVPASVIPETSDNEKEADDRKEKATPAKSKESKLRRKASTEKSEEGTDVEGAEEDVRVTRKLDSGIVNSPESTVGKLETKKRTRKQEEEIEKKNVKEIESSSPKRGNKETKPVTSSQKRFRKDDLQDDKVDTDDELYSKRLSIASPASKGVEEQDDDSDGKRLAKDDKKKGKRERIVSDEFKSDKKLRRGSLKAPQVANLKSEGVESRRLSRGDDSSKAYSSDDMEASKMSDTERNVTKRDSVSKSDPRKAERTYSRAKKADTSLTQGEADVPPVSTPVAKKDRQRDSMAKASTEESTSNKRKSTPATSTKRAARSVTSTPEPTPKRRRAN